MPKTLLLADDSVVIQKLVGLSFANEDVELLTTDNGNDAISMAREHRPDIVLADVVMPGRSGYEVCEAIKGDAELARIPVILLTGTFEAFDEARAQAAGSNGHITKPFEAQALVDRVNALLREAAAAPAPAPAGDDLEIFDAADADQDAAIGRDVTRAAPLAAAPAAGASARDPLSVDDGFDFGAPDGALPSLGDDDPLAAPIDLEEAPRPAQSEPTVALMDDVAEAADDDWLATPVPQAPAPPSARPAAGPPQPPAPDPTASPIARPAASPVARPAANAVSPPAQAPAASSPPPDAPSSVALDPTPALEDARAASGAQAAPALGEPAPASASPAAAPGSADPSLTTIIMSEGASSSDGVAVGEDAAVRLLDDDGAGDGDFGARTMLADDLFDDPVRGDDSDSSFDFGAGFEPVAASAADSGHSLGQPDADRLLDSDPFAVPTTEPQRSTPPEVAARYDVSTSELLEPAGAETMLADPADDGLAAPVREAGAAAPPPSSAPGAEPRATGASSSFDAGGQDLGTGEPAGDDRDDDEIELTDGLLGEPLDLGDAGPRPGAPTERPTAGDPAVPDITPVMRDRIHDTLERVAWEAFADLPDALIKQVVERVEAIAWEVIPQMAEALIKEEIRRIKGEEE